MGLGGEMVVPFDTKYRNKVDLVSLNSFVLSFLLRIKSKRCCQIGCIYGFGIILG